MKHFTWILVVVTALGLSAGGVTGEVIVFQENTDNGSGKYEWEANNWFVPEWAGGPEYRVPNSMDTGRLGTDRSCLIDGQTAHISLLGLGYDASGTGTLTIESGSLHVYGTGTAQLKIGDGSDGTLNINGGTVTVDSDHVHGGFSVGYASSGVAGTVNQTGGTVYAETVVIGRSDGTGYYNISGGTLNCNGRLNVTHAGASTLSVLTISGDATLNLTGTAYNHGLNTYDGGTVNIVGGDATIDIVEEFWVGGYSGTDPNTVLAYELTATGISTIDCKDFLVAADSILDLSADANGAGGTYTLVSSTNEVTQADLNNFRFSDATDTDAWSNLTVTGAGPYEVQVDYSPLHTLTVNSGSGDGDYEASTVVGIVADAPGVGKLFDVWTGDTGNIDDVNEANTTITMPTAAAEITATYEDDPNYEPPGGGERGYIARACGFDMDRNGTIGEAADAHVGDGNTTDPDGDGTDEDLIYVDADDGNDTTGDGSPGNPYKTIQYALNQADGPGDGAEDIICIAGRFYEGVTIYDDGVAGYYMRDSFQFPNNPLMLIGWDKDGDGEYPPYDTDDIAVLDGNIDANKIDMAVWTSGKRSYLEIAHLSITNYGSTAWSTGGALKLFHWGGGTQSHVYVHDVEMSNINRAIQDGSTRIVCSFWGGPFTDVAIINNLVDEYASYFCRGAPPAGAGRIRFQNLTLKMYGISGVGHSTGWKLWGQHNGVEILDNIINTNASAWEPVNHVTGLAVCQGAQDWTIRGNLFIDNGITLQPFAAGYYIGRRLDDILIDQNVFKSTYEGWTTGWPVGVTIIGYTDANEEESVEDATITNNFMYTTTSGWRGGISSGAGNGTGPQIGTITIAGNTICGPFTYVDMYGTKRASAITVVPKTDLAYKQQDYVIKNNVIGEAIDGDKNIEVSYAPTGWVANGNVYDPDAVFRWDETQHWVTISFSEWKTETGQDANSTLDEPLFVDDANYDYHLDPNDTVAQGKGVDISGIVDYDYDGDTRDSSTKTAGADVP